MTTDERKARATELDRRIAEYPYWGAALSAMDEERRGLWQVLRVDLGPCSNPCCKLYKGHERSCTHCGCEP